MRKLMSLLLISSLLLVSCATNRNSGGRPSAGAMATGAMIGGSVGNLIGGNVGYNNRGWRGANRGSAIGSVVGTIAGAAIGAAVSSSQNQNRPSGQYVDNTSNRQNAAQRQTSITGLRIKNVRFIDQSRTQSVNANETSELIFDIVNESDRTAYGVVPIVEEITGNKQISISPSTMISQIKPGEGMRYTANIYAGNKLKDGQITISIVITDENGVEGDNLEFDLPTYR